MFYNAVLESLIGYGMAAWFATLTVQLKTKIEIQWKQQWKCLAREIIHSSSWALKILKDPSHILFTDYGLLPSVDDIEQTDAKVTALSSPSFQLLWHCWTNGGIAPSSRWQRSTRRAEDVLHTAALSLLTWTACENVVSLYLLLTWFYLVVDPIVLPQRGLHLFHFTFFLKITFLPVPFYSFYSELCILFMGVLQLGLVQ